MAFVVRQVGNQAGAAHNAASSIGAAWPPVHDIHNNRLKGFSSTLIEDRFGATTLFATVREVQRLHRDAGRTTFRAFVRTGFDLNARPELTSGEFTIEARIQVPGIFGTGAELVYFGRNHGARVPDSHIMGLEMASVENVQQMPLTNYSEAEARVQAAGYRLELLKSACTEDLGALLRLYTQAYVEYTFAITPESVEDMLSNGNVLVVGRNQDGGIVSALVAEHCTLRIVSPQQGSEESISMYELSDYATLRTDRGHGLMTLMQMRAIQEIRARNVNGNGEVVDGLVVYAEDRAPWTAVNVSSHKAGMTYGGTLPNHCVLVSDRDFGETGRFENLNVWSFPRTN